MLVLGEMRELGDISKQEHQELGNWLKDKANYVVGVSGDSVYMTDYLIGLQNPALQVNRLETNIAAYEYIKDILNTHPEQKFFIVFKSSQGEIRLEEAIKPFILPAQWNNLPRQEQYWLSKKTFMKKIYIAEGEAK